MRIRTVVRAAALAGLISAALADRAATQGEGFVVIVNAENTVSTIEREDLSRIFLKRQVRWGHGAAITPVDQSGSTIRDHFSEMVHGRSAAAVRAFWQQQVFSGRDVPPVEKTGDDEVMRAVAAAPGGIGYVRRGTPLIAGVRTVPVRGI